MGIIFIILLVVIIWVACKVYTDKIKSKVRSEQTLEDRDNIIILKDDETGKDVPFEFLDLIEYMGREFIVLLPTQAGEDDEVVILEVLNSGDPDNEEYVSINDENMLSNVFRIFKEKFKDEFDFTE